MIPESHLDHKGMLSLPESQAGTEGIKKIYSVCKLFNQRISPWV